MEEQLLGLLLVLLGAAVAIVLPWFFPELVRVGASMVRYCLGHLYTASETARARLKGAFSRAPVTRFAARQASASSPPMPSNSGLRKVAPDTPMRRLKEGLHRACTHSGNTLRALGYKVRLGDTLRLVAHDVLGDANRWFELWQLNRSVVDDPRLLVPGTVLVLPRGHVPPTRSP